MKRILLASLAMFALAGSLAADPVFQTRYLSFTDINGDGHLSCGETVTIGVFFQTDAPPVDPTELHGFITMPDVDSVGLEFLSGTVITDHTFTTGCSASTVLQGNTEGDPRARVELICAQDPISLPGGATLALKYQAVYLNRTAPVFTDTATLEFDLRPPSAGNRLHSVDSQQGVATSICGSPPPIVSISKSVSGTAEPGRRLVYTLNITNSSPDPLGGIFAKDVVPANTTFDPNGSSPGWFCPNGGAAGDSCSYLFSALPIGGSTLTFAVTVDPILPPNVLDISNTACVTEATTVHDCDSVSTPAGGTILLSVAKSIVSGTPATPGSVVSFQIDVRNNGNRGAADVILTDTLPAGTSFVASGSAPWTCSGQTCTSDLGTLAAGQTKTTNIALRVPNPLPAGLNTFTNQACAAPITGEAPTCSSASFGVNGAPVLNLKKTLASGDGTPGLPLAFALLLRNDGNQDAAGVTVTEVIPLHTRPDLAHSEPGWTCAPPTCRFNVGNLGAGQQRSLAFQVLIDKPLPAGVTKISNTACAAASQASESCDTIDVGSKGRVVLDTQKTILPPLPGKSRQSGGKVFSGDTVVYLLTVTNTGDQDAAAVVLQETVPTHTTFDPSTSDTGWSCAGGGTAGAACSLSLGPLPSGQSIAHRFGVRVGTLPEGVFTIRNVACAADGNGTASCGEVETPPNTPTSLGAELSAILSDDRDHSGDVTPGDVLEYSAVVQNLGDTKAAAVAFQINAPDFTFFAAGSVTTSAGTVVTGNAPSDTSVKVAIGDLAAHASATITYRVTIRSPLDSFVTQIVSQGGAMAANAASTLTDDPGTPAVNDPTITPLHRVDGPQAADVPTLGQMGLLTLVLSLAGAGARFVRRKPGGDVSQGS
jgi:large repetitive protein